eukprot:IDg8420t1
MNANSLPYGTVDNAALWGQWHSKASYLSVSHYNLGTQFPTAQVSTVHLSTAISSKRPTEASRRGKAHLHHSASLPGVPFQNTLSALRLLSPLHYKREEHHRKERREREEREDWRFNQFMPIFLVRGGQGSDDHSPG